MQTSKKVYLGLDVGTARIGVAVGDSIAKIAQPVATVAADDDAARQLQVYIHDFDVTDVVVGRPRNQAGDTTAQTQLVEEFIAATFPKHSFPIHWQDESVTSILAEERLQKRRKAYSKADIDAEAAAIILQDFLETL